MEPLTAPVDPEEVVGEVALLLPLLPLLGAWICPSAIWTAELWGIASTELANPSPRAKVILENCILVDGIKSSWAIGNEEYYRCGREDGERRMMTRREDFIHGLLRPCYRVLP